MAKQAIYITADAYRRLIDLSQETLPNKACGILASSHMQTSFSSVEDMISTHELRVAASGDVISPHSTFSTNNIHSSRTTNSVISTLNNPHRTYHFTEDESEAFAIPSVTPIMSSFPLVDIVMPIRNIHNHPQEAFSFDPKEWSSAYYNMQSHRQSFVGLFHCQPSSDADPTEHDLNGFVPAFNLSYWIVSLKDRDNPRAQPYVRSNQSFGALQLVII